VTQAIKTALDFEGDSITWSTPTGVKVTLQWVRAYAYSVTTYEGTRRIDERCAAYLTERDARNAAREHAEYYKAQIDAEAAPVPSISTPAETTVDVPGDVLVGLVTWAKGGRYHLADATDAPCNSGRKVIIRSSRRSVLDVPKSKLCRHCRPHIATALAPALTVSMDDRRRNRLVLLVESLRSREQVTSEQESLDDMFGSLTQEVGSYAELIAESAAVFAQRRAARIRQVAA
jgi:hypothetical protein